MVVPCASNSQKNTVAAEWKIPLCSLPFSHKIASPRFVHAVIHAQNTCEENHTSCGVDINGGHWLHDRRTGRSVPDAGCVARSASVVLYIVAATARV